MTIYQYLHSIEIRQRIKDIYRFLSYCESLQIEMYFHTLRHIYIVLKSVKELMTYIVFDPTANGYFKIE